MVNGQDCWLDAATLFVQSLCWPVVLSSIVIEEQHIKIYMYLGGGAVELSEGYHLELLMFQYCSLQSLLPVLSSPPAPPPHWGGGGARMSQ
jgi:hypothetical protein